MAGQYGKAVDAGDHVTDGEDNGITLVHAL